MTFLDFHGPSGGADDPSLRVSDDDAGHYHCQSRCYSCGDAYVEEHGRPLLDTTPSVHTVVVKGDGRSLASCYQSVLRMRVQQSETHEEKSHNGPGSKGEGIHSNGCDHWGWERVVRNWTASATAIAASWAGWAGWRP